MIRYLSILLVLWISTNLIAQTACIDLNDYDSSQVWIQNVIKLEKDVQKDSILQRIKCERIIGKENVKFSLICIVDGVFASNIPQERDYLLERLDSDNMQLIGSQCEIEGFYPEKCNLGFLIISGMEKPIIDNIANLTIEKIDRKKGEIKFVVKSVKSCDFDFRIEDFCNKDRFTTCNKRLKRGTNKIKYSVDNGLKLITILDGDNKLILIK